MQQRSEESFFELYHIAVPRRKTVNKHHLNFGTGLLNFTWDPAHSVELTLCFLSFDPLCFRLLLLQWILRNHFAVLGCLPWFYVWILESKQCEQMEKGLNFFVVVPVLVSEGHEKHCLAVLLRHLWAATVLKGKSNWVFSPAVTLERPSTPTWGFHTCFSLQIFRGVNQRKEKEKIQICLSCLSLSFFIYCITLTDSKSRIFTLFFFWIHRFVKKTQRHSLVPAEYCTRISRQLRWGVLWRQRLVRNCMSSSPRAFIL